MDSAADKRRSLLVEGAWLLGSWAIVLGLVWRLAGKYTGMLDIQMHNTYFVVPVWALDALFFLVLAPLVTSARVLAGRGRNVTASLVLAALSGIWLLIIVAVLLVRLLK